MKISASQVRAILDAYVCHRDDPARGSPTTTGLREPASEDFRRHFEMLPEERDIVVHELRIKIRDGSYFVSSPEIVDALLGRLAANHIVGQ